jgi:aminopeptidase-like protein
MMSKRNLYPTVNDPDNYNEGNLVDTMMRVLSYSDGTVPVVSVADRYDMPVEELQLAVEQLCSAGLLEPLEYIPEYPTRFDHPNR